MRGNMPSQGFAKVRTVISSAPVLKYYIFIHRSIRPASKFPGQRCSETHR